MKAAIIICSRLSSKRVPSKAAYRFKGKFFIQHLIDRASVTRLPVFVGYPKEEKYFYKKLRNCISIPCNKKQSRCPLSRTESIARDLNIDAVIRLTHDKIFISPNLIRDALREFKNKDCEYLYVKDIMDGAGFEIIKTNLLTRALMQSSEDVEHISYACKVNTKKIVAYEAPDYFKRPYRLLFDYRKDIYVFNKIFENKGKCATIHDAIEYLDENPEVVKYNKLPLVTVYTCVYNQEGYLPECINSVLSQSIFSKCEYLIIDDKSTDRSNIVAKNIIKNLPNARVIKNRKNLGLASSSNEALKEAKGKYIIRLDADDYFLNENCIEELVKKIESTESDVVYPAYLKNGKSHKGSDEHHIGGALFLTKIINSIKFMDKLRGYEGFEFFCRAKDRLKIDYLSMPVFFYRQHSESLTKNNLDEREKIKEEICKTYDIKKDQSTR